MKRDNATEAEPITHDANEVPYQGADPARLAGFGPPIIVTDDHPMGIRPETIGADYATAQQRSKHIEGLSDIAPSSTAPITTEICPPLTLAEAREALGMSVRELARYSEISTATIVNLESGNISVALRAGTKEALAEALEVTLSELDRMCAASVNRKGSRRKHRAFYDEDRQKVQSGENEGGLWSWLDMRGRMQPSKQEYEDRLASWGLKQRSKSVPKCPDESNDVDLRAWEERFNMATRTELGHKTRLMSAYGITQKEAAARCELSERAYRRIELGHVEAKEATMRKLAKGFDVDMASTWRLCWESRRRGELQTSIRASPGGQSMTEA